MEYEDPQEIVDRTMAELADHYAAMEVEDEEVEDEPIEGGDGSEQLGEGDPDEDAPGEGTGDEEEVVTLPNGATMALQEIQRLAEFEDYLNTHPDVAARVVAAAQGPAPATPPVTEPAAPAPPPIPDYVDLDEPSTKWFVEQLTHLQTEHQRIVAEDAQRRIEASNYAAEQALLSVKDKLTLTDVEVARLRDYTASLNIVPGIMTRHRDNQVAGFVEALEIAAYSLPEFREKIIEKQVETRNKIVKKDTTRKNNLNKLANRSGGGAPPPSTNKNPKTMTDEERREAMIQDFAQAMDVSPR